MSVLRRTWNDRLGSKARIAAAHISQPLYPNQQTYRNERPATGAATLSEARSLRMPTPAEWRANPAGKQRPPLRSTVPGQI
jgi:hypothetical protein